MLGLRNAPSDVSQHFTAGQLCILLGLDQQSSVIEQLQQPVQRSLRIDLISTGAYKIRWFFFSLNWVQLSQAWHSGPLQKGSQL